MGDDARYDTFGRRDTMTRKGIGAFASLLLVTMWGCGSSGEEGRPTVLQAMVEQGWVSQGGVQAAMPPEVTFCGWVQPGFEGPETYNALTDTFCTVVMDMRFRQEGADVFSDTIYYVVDMGEPAAEPYREIGPWMADDTYYCTLSARIVPEPVGDFPESDIQRLKITATDTSEHCADAIEPGTSFETMLVRSTREDIFFEVNPEGYLFRGAQGYPSTGGVGPDGGGVGTAHVHGACDPTEKPEGPGYCEPTCRAFSGTEELPRCTWQDAVGALPANRDLIDPTWKTEYSDIYDEIFSTD